MADPLPVRAARAGELDRAVDTIALAFAADPFMRWVFPEASDFLEHFRAVLREFGRHAIAHGSVYVAGDFAGAAIWLAPGVHPDDAVLGEVIEKGIRGQRQKDFLAVFEQMGTSHPDETHWYLPMIGVDPSRQSCGVGSALMQHALARVDRDGVHAYLESSNPANISLYERQGFEILGEIRVADSPVVTPMLRRPR
ncbi:MAG TPA: N-acetyltransferase [Myxococcota bacterium]|nr:N-acetyltransferase [Myxococcota bacterium]